MTTSDQIHIGSTSRDRGFCSSVVAEPLTIGDAFEADHFNHSMWLDGRMSPIVMVDHFRMYRRTFEEHPHAGISAATLMFDDSPGSMRSIDSLGKLSEFGPGDLHWTQAGPGVTHNQFPFNAGEVGERPIHALQIFVKLPEELEDAPANSYKVASDQMARFLEGNTHGRVVLGAYKDKVSQGPTPQALLFLDLWTEDEPGEIDIPLSPDWNAMSIPIEGEVGVAVANQVKEPLIVGMARADHIGSSSRITISLAPHSHVVVLAGKPDSRPVYSNGPFAYGSTEGLESAVIRYQSGEFGKCPPMPESDIAWDD